MAEIASDVQLCVHALVELFRDPRANNISQFASFCASITEKKLAALFQAQVDSAPRRSRRHAYFQAHDGRTTSGAATNREEDHLAIALWRTYRKVGFVLPNGLRIFPMDYQLPLKAARDAANKRIGKVDLFCLDQAGRPWIAELKVRSPRFRSRPDTPLKALLQALAYCAVINADGRALAAELVAKGFLNLRDSLDPFRPNLLVLAPCDYWDYFSEKSAAGEWRTEIAGLRRSIESTFGIAAHFVSIRDCRFSMRGNGEAPELVSTPSFEWSAVDC